MRLRGAGAICLAILVNLAANAVQASSLSIRLEGWTFDHNGIFHLARLTGIIVFGGGLLRSLRQSARQAETPSR